MSLLAELKNQGIRLELDGNNLRLPPQKKPPVELLEKIKANKQVIIKELKSKPYKFTRPSSSQELRQAINQLQQGITGYVKFYSHTLGETIYLVKESQISELPEPLVTFTLAELNQLAGCSKEHLQKVYKIKKEFKATVVEGSHIKCTNF